VGFPRSATKAIKRKRKTMENEKGKSKENQNFQVKVLEQENSL
jgi:hypothetical protein